LGEMYAETVLLVMHALSQRAHASKVWQLHCLIVLLTYMVVMWWDLSEVLVQQDLDA
jgi:hypothetical protein